MIRHNVGHQYTIRHNVEHQYTIRHNVEHQYTIRHNVGHQYTIRHNVGHQYMIHQYTQANSTIRHELSFTEIVTNTTIQTKNVKTLKGQNVQY